MAVATLTTSAQSLYRGWGCSWVIKCLPGSLACTRNPESRPQYTCKSISLNPCFQQRSDIAGKDSLSSVCLLIAVMLGPWCQRAYHSWLGFVVVFYALVFGRRASRLQSRSATT
jgi:hypothetical protein